MPRRYILTHKALNSRGPCSSMYKRARRLWPAGIPVNATTYKTLVLYEFPINWLRCLLSIRVGCDLDDEYSDMDEYFWEQVTKGKSRGEMNLEEEARCEDAADILLDKWYAAELRKLLLVPKNWAPDLL